MADKVDFLWDALRDPKNKQFSLVDEEIDGVEVTFVVTKDKKKKDQAVAVLLPDADVRDHVLSILCDDEDGEEDEDERSPGPRRRFSP